MPEFRTLQFLGGAGITTGSKYLLRMNDSHVLLDCGLRNRDPLPIEPRDLEGVILSSACMDHAGCLPLLVRAGFHGPIFCTPGTAALLGVLLENAARSFEEDADYANQHGHSGQQPARPLYTVAEADAVSRLLRPHPYGTPFAVSPGGTAVLRRAGYVLGSATIELRLGDQDGVCLVSAGALGRSGRPILRGPDPVAMADVLLVDAMYGDRAGAGDPSDTLARIVCDTAERRGAVVVPVGLAGEAQELLWALHELEQAGRVPSVPVFVDGPMATDLTEQYGAHLDDHNLHLAQLMDVGGSVLRSARYELVRSIADSMSLTDRPGPIIILSGDAMAAGGRVLHHLKRRLADERTIVLLPGHQAAGTPGRALCDGALELRIHGEHVPVRARVIAADGFSPHADRDETLRWLGMFHHLPRTVHVVRGEPAAAMALAEAIRARFGCHATVARDGETVGLEQ